jgi:dipeptidyl aminopeptidase/acylaminoacyl peptidase
MQTPSRRAVLGASSAALILGTHEATAQSSSNLAIRTTDYAVERQTFQTRLTQRRPAPQPGAMPRPPANVREIEYPSGDLRLKAWVGLPANPPERAPLVVFLHGGFAFGPSDYTMAEPYLAAGYAIATPILRGENGQRGHFSLFYNEVDDVIAATEILKMQPFIDPEHIYLAGHSVGGTLTMLTGMASSNYRALAPISGSPDQMLFTAGGMRETPFDRTNTAEFEMRSPLSFAASFKAPARLFYGTQEGFFRTTTQRTAQIASAAGLNVQAVEVEGDHFSAVPGAIAQSIELFRSNV